MFNIGAGEITLILVVALLVLGPQRLPELARGLGKFMRAFRRQTDEVRSVIEREFYRMDQDVADFELPAGKPNAVEPPDPGRELEELPPHDEFGRPLPRRDTEGTQVTAPPSGSPTSDELRAIEETPTHVGPRGAVPSSPGSTPAPPSSNHEEVTQVHERLAADAPALEPESTEGPLGPKSSR